VDPPFALFSTRYSLVFLWSFARGIEAEAVSFALNR